MKTIAVLLTNLLFMQFAISQVITGVYTKTKGHYEPRYSAIDSRIVYKFVEKDKSTKYVSVLISNNIPDLWFPIVASGRIVANPDTIVINTPVLKPVLHKLFDEYVFFSPLSGLDTKTNSKLVKNAVINASRFYLKNYEIDKSKQIADPCISVGYQLSKETIDFLGSFYFKKHEVTNSEYKEFTEWVKDSIAMELLINAGFNEFKIENSNKTYFLNWKNRQKIWKLQDEEAVEALSELYNTQTESFIRNKQVDYKKVIYNKVMIYPDTTVWLQDFSYSYNEPLAKNYFSHPDYKDYPVVGINWYQAKAFCEWKTKMIQLELDKAKLLYKVIVDLPTEFEREYVLTQFSPDAENEDKSYLNTLFYNLDYTKWKLGEGILWSKTGTYKKNGFLYTHPADILKVITKDFDSNQKALLLADVDKNGICGLKSNVSEWMNESYQDNWLPTMEMRHKIYQSIDVELYRKQFSGLDTTKISKKDYNSLKEEIENLETANKLVYPIHYQLEKGFENLLDKDGKLVRGSNWHDETFERNKIVNAKTFISPWKSFSTVGFRHVIRIYYKE